MHDSGKVTHFLRRGLTDTNAILYAAARNCAFNVLHAQVTVGDVQSVVVAAVPLGDILFCETDLLSRIQGVSTIAPRML
jgi:hypothetical protein